MNRMTWCLRTILTIRLCLHGVYFGSRTHSSSSYSWKSEWTKMNRDLEKLRITVQVYISFWCFWFHLSARRVWTAPRKEGVFFPGCSRSNCASMAVPEYRFEPHWKRMVCNETKTKTPISVSVSTWRFICSATWYMEFFTWHLLQQIVALHVDAI